MAYKYGNTLAMIFKHKEYFDSFIIKELERKTNENKNLRSSLDSYILLSKKRKYIITTLNLKINEQKVQIYNLKSKIKDKDIDIKEIEKQIDRIDSRIDNELEKLKKEYEKLIKENDELKEELRKQRYGKKNFKPDSTNSSLPPSKDFKSHHVINSRVKSNKPKGGQLKHKGHFSKFNKPDEIITKRVIKAPLGAKPHFNSLTNDIDYYITQSINVKFKTYVKEYHYVLDPKGTKLDDKELTKYKINSVIYEDEFKALTLMFNNYANVPLDKLANILNNVSNNVLSLKPSSIVKWNKELANKSKEDYSQIINNLINSSVVNVDETSWRINGKNSWLHTLVNKDNIAYLVTNSRSDDIYGPIALLSNYKGVLVHDHFKPYLKINLPRSKLRGMLT